MCILYNEALTIKINDNHFCTCLKQTGETKISFNNYTTRSILRSR